jgi:Ca-activated chloride channel family protein
MARPAAPGCGRAHVMKVTRPVGSERLWSGRVRSVLVSGSRWVRNSAACMVVSLPLAGNAQLPTFATRVDRVLLTATAVDGKGRPVRDLKPQEFKIFEEGRPQRLAHFAQGSDLKARVLLLVDASGSMDVKAKTTSTQLVIAQVLVSFGPEDEVALAGFDSRYFGLVPFTRDRDAILEKIDELRPWGTTALHDALDQAARDIASHGEGRRAIVLLTDGVDNASVASPDEVIARSQALDVPIYTVSVVSPLDDPDSPSFVGAKESSAEALAAKSLLERYSALSGGRAFPVSNLRGIQEAARQISDELKHQYRLGYDPPQGPPRFRRVEIRTTRRGVAVRTRTGYVPRL